LVSASGNGPGSRWRIGVPEARESATESPAEIETLAVSLGLVSEERRREERGDAERRRVKSGKASRFPGGEGRLKFVTLITRVTWESFGAFYLENTVGNNCNGHGQER